MNKKKISILNGKGWIVGNVRDFLGLSIREYARIEKKISSTLYSKNKRNV